MLYAYLYLCIAWLVSLMILFPLYHETRFFLSRTLEALSENVGRDKHLPYNTITGRKDYTPDFEER